MQYIHQEASIHLLTCNSFCLFSGLKVKAALSLILPFGPGGPIGPTDPGTPGSPWLPVQGKHKILQIHCFPSQVQQELWLLWVWAVPLSPLIPKPGGPGSPLWPAGPSRPLRPCGPSGPCSPDHTFNTEIISDSILAEHLHHVVWHEIFYVPWLPFCPLGPSGPGCPIAPGGPEDTVIVNKITSQCHTTVPRKMWDSGDDYSPIFKVDANIWWFKNPLFAYMLADFLFIQTHKT